MPRTFYPLFDPPMRHPILGPNGQVDALSPWERWFTDIRELLHKHFVYEVSWTPAAVAANTAAEQSVTVTGVRTDMGIYITPPSITAGVAPVCARVSADDTVQVAFVNATAGALTPPAGTYKFVTVRP